MEILHHRYKSFPEPARIHEQRNQDNYGALRNRIAHGLSRLKAWEHMEIRGFKGDGFDSDEVNKQYRFVLSSEHLDTNDFVVRRESNIFRVWRLPMVKVDWRAITRRALEMGAELSHNRVTYMAGALREPTKEESPKTYLDLLREEKNK